MESNSVHCEKILYGRAASGGGSSGVDDCNSTTPGRVTVNLRQAVILRSFLAAEGIQAAWDVSPLTLSTASRRAFSLLW
jgi:hypothetical protein